MRSILIGLVVFIPNVILSQDFNTVYYNDKWELTSMSFASYYRNSGFNLETLSFDSLVVDHYMNGNIEMTGRYMNGMKYGSFIYYYPGGKPKLTSWYRDDQRDSIWTSYYENGQIRLSVVYRNGAEILLNYFDESGKEILKNLTGKFSLTFFHNTYDDFITEVECNNCQKLLLSGNVNKGYKTGTWTVKESDRDFGNSFSKRKIKDNWRVLFRFNYENSIPTSSVYTRFNKVEEAISFDTLSYMILEPEKIKVTERLLAEQGQIIRQNYVIKAIKDNDLLKKRQEIESYRELPGFFSDNFAVFYKNCADTKTIAIS